jgi:SAM-dependent methyltransferase
MSPSTSALRDDRARFFDVLLQAIDGGTFVKLVLSKYRGPEADLQRATLRAVLLREVPHLSVVSTHSTRDVTKNLPVPEALAWLDGQVGTNFLHANLMTAGEDVQLLVSKKGRCTLLRKTTQREDAVDAESPSTAHDREKRRFVELDRPFLAELGVTTRDGQLVPAMSRKWKQINKFVEVFSHALASSPLANAKEVHVTDFGSGKGYLTFAIHDHLRHTLGRDAHVTGVELRPDMVALGNAAVARLGLQGLRFAQGDIRTHAPGPLNVMIALHACDTATDHALHLGVRAGADIVLCSPCCHKELRPQLLSPHPLRPLLQHGIHLGQQAEMLTDGLRAMLLETCGYDTQVFEFVALEHTAKNKMILGTRRVGGVDAASREAVRTQIEELKGFYGVRDQCLEQLLRRGKTIV